MSTAKGIASTFPLKNGNATIVFYGKEGKDTININEILKKLEETLINVDPQQISKIIIGTRLLFKDCSEEELSIYITTDKITLSAKYKNRELVEFERKEKIEEDVILNTLYKKNKVFDCSLSGDKIESVIAKKAPLGEGQFILLCEYSKYMAIAFQSLVRINEKSDIAARICDLYKIFMMRAQILKKKKRIQKFKQCYTY